MANPVDIVADQRSILRNARGRGVGATTAAYFRLSGPGWMQAAMTLGAGSLASSLYLGVLGGTHLLWVSPLSLALGIVMLSAICYVTLSTDEPPLLAMNRHINPILGWVWGIAVLASNIIWILPQFALTTDVVQENLLPRIFGSSGLFGETQSRIIVSLITFTLALSAAWLCAASGRGAKLYDLLIKIVVGVIVISFLLVVVTLSIRENIVDWGAVARGFIPHIDQAMHPVQGLQDMLAGIRDTEVRNYWSQLLVGEQRNIMIAAASSAVGLNMTFQLAYSLRSRGWDREFRGLAIFDLWTGLLVPFTLVVTCVSISAASQFFTIPADSILDVDGEIVAAPDNPKLREFYSLLNRRFVAIPETQSAVEPSERILAASLIRRSAGDLANALTPLLGRTLAQLVFGIGVIGMTLSSMSLIFLISGWLVCEMFGKPLDSKLFYVGTLCGSTGLLWPLLWGKDDVKFWLAITASVAAFILLPIAYWAFFLMMNSRTVLGDAMPTGTRRWCWNTVMVVACGAVTIASLYVMTERVGVWGWVCLIAFLAVATLAKLRVSRKKVHPLSHNH